MDFNTYAIANEAIIAASILAPMGVFGVAIGISQIAEGLFKGMGKNKVDKDLEKELRSALIAPAAMVEGVCIFAVAIAYMMASGGLDLLRSQLSG